MCFSATASFSAGAFLLGVGALTLKSATRPRDLPFAAIPLLSNWIFVACGVWLIGLGGYFMLARPPLLPEDLRYLGSSATQVEVLLPRLASWLRNVFTVMGGFIAGSGVLMIFVGMRAVPQALRGTGAALGCADE